MMDTGFRPEYVTTTNITHTQVQTNLRYDPSYIRRKDAILKVIQFTLSFLGFICIQCSSFALHPIGKFFSTVSMLGVWITAILLGFYIFHCVEKFYKIPWIKFELLYCGVMVLLFLIASSMTAPITETKAFQAAAFFGFCAMIGYAVDAYFKFRAMRAGALAQGERQISKETTAVTTPTY